MQMLTYAAYHAANPLPNFPAPLRIEYAVEPKAVGRIHRIAVIADSAPKALSTADYIAALSKTEWRCATRIANDLGVATRTVITSMRQDTIVNAVEKRVMKRAGRPEWRLK